MEDDQLLCMVRDLQDRCTELEVRVSTLEDEDDFDDPELAEDNPEYSQSQKEQLVSEGYPLEAIEEAEYLIGQVLDDHGEVIDDDPE